MKELAGRVAVVTGAASGIGRGMAETFAEAGMKVVLSDIQEPLLRETTETLRRSGHAVHAVVTDVSRPQAIEALAEEATQTFGNVHVLCNNAGIATGVGPVWEATVADWDWILGVNLSSVLYGIQAFVPRMLRHGEGGHIVNTASMAGLIAGADSGLYAATKFGVVSLSETLYLQLQRAGTNVSASVLCPAWVNTNILDSEQTRPTSVADAPPLDGVGRAMQSWVEEQIREGLPPREVGLQVLDAIRAGRFYILTHPKWTPLVEQRMQRLLNGENPQFGMVPGFESLMQKLSEVS